jgi:DNA-binding NtrC family response regulator
MNVLLSQAFPGNVRELQNMLRRVVVLQEGGLVTAAMLDLHKRPDSTVPAIDVSVSSTNNIAVDIQFNATPIRSLAEVEREHIEQAISQCNGSVIEAARQLGVSDSTLYRKLSRWIKST